MNESSNQSTPNSPETADSQNSTLKAGIDLSYIDSSVRPQDDLFYHVNGKWLKEAVIPEDRASDGAFYTLFETAEKQVREIIENGGAQSALSAAGNSGNNPANNSSNKTSNKNSQKIFDLYQSFLAEERIENLGIAPIAKFISQIEGISNLAEFLQVSGELDGLGLTGFFYMFINTDDKDSTKYATFIGQSGLSLPDEAFYREPAYAEIRTALLAHIAAIYQLIGVKDPEARAKDVLALETKIASFHWDQVKSREADLIYNKFSLSDLQSKMKNFNWENWANFSQTPIPVISEMIVHQPSFFEGLDGLLASEDLQVWKSWLLWHLLHELAPFLPKAFVVENFNFYGKVLSGTPMMRPRWKRGVSLVESILGEAIGEIYVAKHFPSQAKARMEKLVANLLQAYRESISELTWMTEATKERAYRKLDTFLPKIGYPDKWRDYSKLEISPDDLIGNILAANAFARDYEFSKIGQSVDRTLWFMTPQTVNAYYNPGLNEIVFPAAILQPPFFDLDADDAANYGGIGAVIGHEIGHGFDDQGSKYDEFGNLENWWQEADRLEFEKRANALIEQYNNLSPRLAPEVKVNGALTIGENIGDLGGLAIAYRAYLISTQGISTQGISTQGISTQDNSPIIDNLTGAQRFFFGWAQIWRGKNRPEEVKRRIAIDPHSPEEFRCNQVLKNFTPFYQAFDVKEGDALYLHPSERVQIW